VPITPRVVELVYRVLAEALSDICELPTTRLVSLLLAKLDFQSTYAHGPQLILGSSVSNPGFWA
jgi:hypothetical protein